MDETTDTSAQEKWVDFLFRSLDPQREFVAGGATIGTIQHWAGKIRGLTSADACLCLCSHDKTLVAAALIASLTGGPRLVFPYAFSRQALESALENMPIAWVLTDQPEEMSCPETAVISPQMLEKMDTSPVIRFIDNDEPFLTLFTGGSTGTPKIWDKTPRNLIEEACYICKRFSIAPADIFLATVPPQHIYGLLFAIMVPLVASARVLPDIYVLPRAIMTAMENFQATVLISVPPCYHVLDGDFPAAHHLRLAFSSAGVLEPDAAARFHKETGIGIHEIYGSTETGGIATRCHHDGKAVWNVFDPVAWQIVDDCLQVRSPFLSPSLTKNQDGFFVTADRAERSEQGRFILRGRADDVVKIGGKRVDLREIQEKIKQIDGVQDAAVILTTKTEGRRTDLSAFVVSQIDPAELRQKMMGQVEAYAIHRRFISVEKIPVTPTGKLDRQALELLAQSRKTSL
ncbi:MAG: acyl--CoA ligase [Syntrophobacterales bacterium]|nr:acyl--CoA ligase [Syntrophobacterales bacterium]